jgi:hypothetical protein
VLDALAGYSGVQVVFLEHPLGVMVLQVILSVIAGAGVLLGLALIILALLAWPEGMDRKRTITLLLMGGANLIAAGILFAR